ncbi:MAG: electron transfer flavoprotein subunit alpha [Bryobacterales bacterium]|jgi:electron transfer flavoprotein alpha subunit|nr:electron transfer flavoprotein subunit alpha [Bryobacterales bacterium]
METILVLAHVEADGTLGRPAREAIAAARAVREGLAGSSLVVGLAGAGAGAAAPQTASCGAARWLAVEGPEFGEPRYATDAAAAQALAEAASAGLVIAASTSRWARTLAGVAQRLGGRVDTHVTGVAAAQGKVAVSRWFYRQRMEAEIERAQRPWFILVDPGCFQPWAGEPGPVAVERVAASGSSRTRFVEYREPVSGEQTIRPDAELLFVAGAGWTKKQPDGKTHTEQAGALILDFLRKSRASLGSSKSLVDLGSEGHAVLPFLTHMNQVGQTGSTPRHPKGLATCCHGEEPHVVGWRFVNERRAVNLDPNCGWAQGKADVLYVADAFTVMAKVDELLG